MFRRASLPVLRQNLVLLARDHLRSARHGREGDPGQDTASSECPPCACPSGLAMGGRERAGDTGPVTPFGAHTTEEAGLRGLTDVAVVQAADFGTLHDLPCHGELDRPEIGCVLVQREMGTRLMVVGEVSGQDATEVSLAEDEHVIQALAPDRANEPLHERVRIGYRLQPNTT